VADRLRGLEIDDQLEIGRLLDRNVGWLDATKRFDNHPRRLAEDAGQASAISYQAAFFRYFRPFVDSREPQRGGALDNEAAVGEQQRQRQHVNRGGASLPVMPRCSQPERKRFCGTGPSGRMSGRGLTQKSSV